MLPTIHQSPTIRQVGDVELADASSPRLCRPLERIINWSGCVSPSNVISMIRAHIPLHQDTAVMLPQLHVTWFYRRVLASPGRALSHDLLAGLD